MRKVGIILFIIIFTINTYGFASDIEFERNKPENVFSEIGFNRYIIKVDSSIFDKDNFIESKILTEFLHKNINTEANNIEAPLHISKELPNDRLVITLNKEMPSDMFCDFIKENIDGIIEIQPDYYLTLFSNSDIVEENIYDVIDESETFEEHSTQSIDNITIALIDSVVDLEHPDLKNHVSELNEEANTIVRTNLESAHGTHIAGLLSGFNEENQNGKIGVLSLPAFHNQKAFTSDIIDKIAVARENGAQIVNCSWGGDMPNPALEETILSSTDMLFICAAGNERRNIDSMPIYPASLEAENVITVTSVNEDGGISFFSNYGEKNIDITALGKDVLSTFPNGKYGIGTGTSISTAKVSRSVAMLLSANPDMSFSDVKTTLLEGSDKISPLVGKVKNAAKLSLENSMSGIKNTQIQQIQFVSEFNDYSTCELNSTEQWSMFNSNSNKKAQTGNNTTIVLKNDGSVWAWGSNASGLLGNGTTIDLNVPTKIDGLSNITDISASNNLCMALRNDGTVWWWGVNGTVKSFVPKQVLGFDNISQVEMGYNHFMVLDENGDVWTWGSNTEGQLGTENGSTSTPQKITTIGGIKRISAGYNFSLALNTEGNLYSWGKNDFGQLATGDFASNSVPNATGYNFDNISAGFYHVLATKDNVLYSWGKNEKGALGIGDETQNIAQPRQTLMSNISDISAGCEYSMVLTENNELYSCGENNYGKLGNGNQENSKNFSLVYSLNNICSIDAGYTHSLAIDKDGKLYTWGNNRDAQLGDGSTGQRKIPYKIETDFNAADISSGYLHSVALDDEGKVWTWGNNKYGQLGLGDTDERALPTPVSLPVEVKNVKAGYYHTVVLDENGEIWTWGYNNRGQLGNAQNIDNYVPEKINNFNQLIDISAGYYHTLALKSDGTVWAWGYNNHGQLGTGNKESSALPIQVEGLSGIVAIAAGNYHSLAVKADGTVWAWGYNNHGQLGTNNTTEYSNPQMIDENKLKLFVAEMADESNFKIEAGYFHSTAITNTGEIYTWGYNNYGQLGIGSTTQKLIPTKIPNTDKFIEVSSKVNSSVVVTENKELYSWGYNNRAQLGLENTTNQKAPVKITNIDGVIKASIGNYHCIALKDDGTIWSWGYNDYGQLGDGRIAYSNLPYCLARPFNPGTGDSALAPLRAGVNQTIRGTLIYNNQEDWFQLCAPVNGAYTFNINGNVNIDLYNFNGSEIVSSSLTQGQIINLEYPSVYLIKVFGGLGEYSFNIAISNMDITSGKAFNTLMGNNTYYANYKDNGSMYKDSIKLTNDPVMWLCSGNNTLFYTKLGNLYKYTTSESKIASVNAYYLTTDGTYLYFSNWSDGGKLYRCTLSGSYLTLVCKDVGKWLSLDDTYIYYYNELDEGKKYRVLKSASNVQCGECVQ